MDSPIVDGTMLQFEPHRVRVEGPLVHITARGNLTAVNMAELLDLYQKAVDEHGLVLILLDVHESTGIDMAARKVVIPWAAKNAAFMWSGVYGANMFVRTAMNMYNRAVRVLGKREPALKFFVDEAAAREWLRERYEIAKRAV